MLVNVQNQKNMSHSKILFANKCTHLLRKNWFVYLGPFLKESQQQNVPNSREALIGRIKGEII